jgi:hypothetical protein
MSLALANRAPPFNSITAKIAGEKGRKARWAKIHALKEACENLEEIEKEVAHGNSRPNPGHIALLRRAQRRWLCCAISACAIHMQERYMLMAKEAFDMEQRIMGREPLDTKKGSRKNAPALGDYPMPDKASCGVKDTTPVPDPERNKHRSQLTQDASESGKCGVDTTKAFPASGTASHATETAKPEVGDDCPF